MTNKRNQTGARSDMEAHAACDWNPFADSRAYFEQVITRLMSSETACMTHGQLENSLSEAGTELIRLLMQDHLDLRATRELQLDWVEGSDERIRSHHREERSTILETIFGTVIVRRRTYEGRGLGRLSPADAALNLPSVKYSHGLQRRVAIEASKGSFDEAVEAVERNTGGHVPKRQAEQLAVSTANDFDAFYATREAVPPSEDASILVTTFDGKGVVVRPQDLRKETRKKADKATRKLQTRLSPGEKRNRKRMACVAAVYAIAPHVRAPEDIIRDLEPIKPVEKTPRPRPENKRVWASLREPPESVIASAYAEATSRDPNQAMKWVTLVDGNENQINLALAYQELANVDITIVVDFVHVCEYLWKAAYALHGTDGETAEEWMRARLLRILRGEASQVAAGMRRSATKRGLSASERTPVDTCAGYLLKYKSFLQYDEYLSKGLPIATGVIEGACRHLVKDRMDVPGYWSLDGAEAVLQLRALRISGDFDAYWTYHEHAELKRNHLSSYAEESPPFPWPTMTSERGRLRLVHSG